MGTSQAFFLIRNSGLNPDQIKKKQKVLTDKRTKPLIYETMLEEYRIGESPEFIKGFEAFIWHMSKYKTLPPDKAREYLEYNYIAFKKLFKPETEGQPRWIKQHISRQEKQNSLNRNPVIAYNKTAKWFPFFDANLCEGSIEIIDDLKMLSRIFGVPVLAFSVFDSDGLFVSFTDQKNMVDYHHVKPNTSGFQEFDVEVYKTVFPTFLLDFCDNNDHKKLTEIWNSDQYIFAEDRMVDMCAILGISVLYNDRDAPDGFYIIE